MELKLNKKDFADNFLSIISKAVDIATVNISKEGLWSVCNKPDAGIIVYGKYNAIIDIEDPTALNIGDLKKFLRVVDCIDEEVISFTVNSNNLVYKTPKLQFKYHFLDDAVVPKTAVKREKLETLTLETFFDIDQKKLQELLKASAFTVDSNKVYIYTDSATVSCELGDREKSNTDNITLRVADGFEGNPISKPIPFTLDIFRTLSSIKFEKARIGINQKNNILSFNVKTSENISFIFVVSGLVK